MLGLRIGWLQFQPSAVNAGRLFDATKVAEPCTQPFEGSKFTEGSWIERQRLLVGRYRLIEPPQPVERIAAIVESLDVVGSERQCLIVGSNRLVEPCQPAQCVAATAKGLGLVGPDSQRPIVGSDGLVVSLQLIEH